MTTPDDAPLSLPAAPSRHRISWNDLADKTVGIWGFGKEGHASLDRLRHDGNEPSVIVDLDPGKGVTPQNSGGLDRLAECDVVIKAPGISRYSPEAIELDKAGTAIVGAVGLWLETIEDRRSVVMVTGTKGKSTTTSLLAHLLEQAGKRTFLGGNIGTTPFSPEVPDDVDVWVIETSSFQVTDLASAPGTVVVTALNPDHLPWHAKNVEVYYRDKLSLTTLPGDHVTIANGTDPTLAAHRALLPDDTRWVTDPPAWPTWLDHTGLLGEHNRRNGVLASAALDALGVDVDSDTLTAAAETYTGLECRLSDVGEVDGVRYINDSLATNALPTIAALRAFPDRPLAVIVGGHDRGIAYHSIGDAARERTSPTLIVGMPTNGGRILDEIGDGVDTVMTADLRDAVMTATRWAKTHDGATVALSPAAPSFDFFDSYRHRADVFIEIVNGLRH